MSQSRRKTQRVRWRRRPSGPRSALKHRFPRPRIRHWHVAGGVVGGIVMVAGIAILLLAIRLALGPIIIEGLSQRVANALSERLGPSWSVSVADTVIEHAGLNPSLRITGVDIRNPQGLHVLNAPTAIIAVDPMPLLIGRFVPKSLQFTGLDLRVAVTRDGTLELSAGNAADKVKATPSEVKPKPAPDVPDPTAPNPIALQSPDAPATDAAATPAPADLPIAISTAAASFVELLTAADGALGTLDVVGVEGAQLTLVGADHRERFAFKDASLVFRRPKDNLRQFVFGLTGAAGRWALKGTIAGRAGDARQAAIEFDGVVVSDLLLLAGKGGGMVTTDMPLSGLVQIAVTGEGKLQTMTTNAKGAASIVKLDDPDLPEVMIDGLDLAASWDASAGAIRIDRFAASSGGTNIALNGVLAPGPDSAPWRLTLTGENGIVAAGLLPDERPTKIDRIEAQATGVPAGGATIDNLSVKGADFAATLTGSVGTLADRGGLSLALSAAPDSNVRPLLHLWPATVAPPVRQYLIENLRAGRATQFSVDVKLSDDELKASREHRPIPDTSVRTSFAVTDATFRPAEGLPPLVHADISGLVTGRTAQITIPNGTVPLPEGRSLAVDGDFKVPDTFGQSPAAVSSLRLRGGADAVVTLLEAQALHAVMPLDIPPGSITGDADLRVNVGLNLNKTISAKDVRVTANGSLKNVSLDGFFGKDKLEGADLAVVLDKSLLTIKGDGKLTGLPVTLDVRQPFGGAPGEASLTAILDEAARAKRGISLGKQLTGPVAVTFTVPLARETGRKGPKIEVDFAKAAIDGLVPGWSKPAGKAARMTFTLLTKQSGGYTLDDLTLDGAGSGAKGSVDLTADGALEKAKFSSFKLSPGDDMRAEVERVGSVYKVNVKAAVVDARPFLKALNTGAETKEKAGDGKDFDLDLTASILAGFNDEAITNATLKLGRRGKDLRQLAFGGHFGKALVSVELGKGEDGDAPIVIRSEDAGALLRFGDLYRRMIGGTLYLQLTPRGASQVGTLLVSEFSLRDEPALKRIVSQQPAGSSDTASSQPPRINAENVPFTRLQAQFVRTAGRFELRDGVIWGPQVGINLDGYVDFSRDRTDLTGTFVPAYALNNAFAKVPLFGPLLGGGRTEGLFAVSFRITGPASAPTLTVNPLSAVAPGIFRKFLEAFTPGAPASAPPTGSVPTPAPPPPSER